MTPVNVKGVDVGTRLCDASVLGDHLLLTNAHCIKGEDAATRFFAPPGYDPEKPILTYSAKLLVKGSAIRSEWYEGKDWAFLLVSDKVEKTIGNLTLKKLDFKPFVNGRGYDWAAMRDGFPTSPFISVGFPSDQVGEGVKSYRQKNCMLFGVNLTNTILYHWCDQVDGDSGGPILYQEGRNYAIVAINSFGGNGLVRVPVMPYGGFANRAIPVANFYDIYLQLVKEYRGKTDEEAGVLTK